jgi:hypothetical protein
MVVIHGGTLDAGAADDSGRLALVYGTRAGAPDFSGLPNGVGLSIVVAGSDGRVSAPAWLTTSPTATAPSAALASNEEAVVAWSDKGAAPLHGSVWVGLRSASGDLVTPQLLSGDALGGVPPAVAADGRGDAVVAWVDGESREVMASLRSPGGAFGPAMVASPQESSSYPLAVTMDPSGTATLAWRADGPAGWQPTGTPQPPALVMAASAPRGGPFNAPRPALTGPPQGYVYDLTAESSASGHVLVGAWIMADPSIVSTTPSGNPPLISYALASGGAAFGTQHDLAAPQGLFGPAWALADDGHVLEAHSQMATTVLGQLLTSLLGPVGSATSEAPFEVAPPGPGAVARIAPGFDSAGDSVVVFTTDSASSAFGNPAAGSIWSVVRRAGASNWCPAQLISGLMSPYFVVPMSFDGNGGGIIAYQQNPRGDVAISLLHPYSGCAPAAGASPIALGATAIADRALRTATMAARGTALAGWKGRLMLLDGAARSIASGPVSTTNRHSTTIRLTLTARGRSALRRYRHIRVTALLRSGRQRQRLPQPITLRWLGPRRLRG